ncbi:RES family NAD+ phosphorylase [Mucilaginibacter sp. BJC16-A38]|uniref:RES family NAD+ phosphorylase n=1 Tax=Mucilaginibacter phenanthrenivorans TaxID=1234842 RepID=UPI002158181D|nr:RES family NAD+ phosphorylase [Mucilaginibacter phenanthrenivorans]MCR8557428.1 RES family NAD+ phosphorylase [Mucilaginibacter phenanthrenivorans]
MLVYRITLTKYANQLVASGRAARWNPNDVEMIYTASSRSLACLENVVHRDKLGLSMVFSILTIECPSSLKIKTISLKDLSVNWIDYDQMTITQRIGEKWVKDNESAILQVPSSIVSEEVNYLINPKHTDFKLIKIVKAQPFVFDSRIKL